MTSRSRKKRQITLPLVLTLASLAAGPLSAQEEPRTLPGVAPAVPGRVVAPPAPPKKKRRSAEEEYQIIRARTTQIIPDSVRMKRGSGVAEDDDQYYYAIETKPPTGEKLYTAVSEDAVLRSIEKDFRAKDPNQPFLLPAPEDYFEVQTLPTLGPNWFQNRKTGRLRPGGERKGEMYVSNGRGVYPAGAPVEASINTETVGSNDAFASIDIELGTPEARFGLVVRAQDPNNVADPEQADEGVDQTKANKFYFAAVSADTVEVGKSIDGIRTVLQTATMEPKLKCRLSVTVFNNEIRILRDEAEVLRIVDSSIPEGEYTGIIGLSSPAGRNTTFENFLALRYGGPFNPRQYAQTIGRFPGPNVHYFPLYFEQVQLERYGLHLGNLVQPWISHGMFFVDLAGIFYSMGKSCPWACHSNDGYFKPGDIVLPMKALLPDCDLKGAAFQTAATALVFSLVP